MAFDEPISKTLCGVNVTQLNNKMSAMDQEDDAPENARKPGMNADSRAFIGLKLRELYDDVVAEPVPDRFLELLGKLGENDDTSRKK